MRILPITTLAGIVYLLTGTSCLADAPNFSGHWVLDASASKMRFKPESSQTMDITQNGSTMNVLVKTGNLTEKHVYVLDGSTKKENVEGIVTVEICAKMQGSTMQLTSSAGKSKTVQTWQLVDGGKTLEIDSDKSGLVSVHDVYKYRKP